MFVKSQNDTLKKDYFKLLKIVGSLSNLFSESKIPYLHYRVAENIFCKSFTAKNLSRSDCSADALVNEFGIGIKTYLNNNGKTYQKIAEFNKARIDYEKILKKPQSFVKHISKLRNKRIESTQGVYDVENLIYHCVVREKNKFLIFEEDMEFVNINNIKNIYKKGNSIFFQDNLNEYLFNVSKSTLFKKFYTFEPIEVSIKILNDPYETLQKLFNEYKLEYLREEESLELVILPLYSFKTGKVEERSGLNQWNARGRPRKPNEVYIPVPIWIHRQFPNFFPRKDVVFNLHLPNKNIIKAKMCQESKVKINGGTIDKGKGLMSNPNTDLGKWLLRDILKAKERELISYKMLEDIGIDSVEVRKIDKLNYEIDFKKLNSYQEFFENNI